MSSRLPLARIARSILIVRDARVMIDEDLATLYGVETRALNQAVARNRARFPADFAFRLTRTEAASLRSQTVILDAGRGQHRKYRPWAFTEQGVAMLSSVLRSPRAVSVNVQIMRAFIQFRRLADSNADLVRRLDAIETRYDGQFRRVFEAIRALIQPPAVRARRIGFRPDRRP
jgi:hypothetical protein